MAKFATSAKSRKSLSSHFKDNQTMRKVLESQASISSDKCLVDIFRMNTKAERSALNIQQQLLSEWES